MLIYSKHTSAQSYFRESIGGLCYDSIPRNSRDKLTFYGIKKMQKPKGSKHTSRCVVAIKNPGIFRYFW